MSKVTPNLILYGDHDKPIYDFVIVKLDGTAQSTRDTLKGYDGIRIGTDNTMIEFGLYQDAVIKRTMRYRLDALRSYDIIWTDHEPMIENKGAAAQ